MKKSKKLTSYSPRLNKYPLKQRAVKDVRLVFFGNERLATGVSTSTPVLRALVASGYDVTVVIANQNRQRSRQKRGLEIAAAAKLLGIPLLLPDKLEAISRQLRGLQAEAAVLVAYGSLIPKDIIKIFPKGIINIHPSLLPLYRGPTPIEQTILDGVTHTGASLMKLTTQMDEGPVYSQKSLRIAGNETKQELADKLLEMGKKLLIQKLPSILDGSLEPHTQDSAKATRTTSLKKTDGFINWQLPAQIIERQVRAYQGWPKTQTKIFGHDVIITKTRVANSRNDGDLVIECGPGPDAEGSGLRPERRGWLDIQQLTAPSGRTMSGADFLHGYTRNRI